MFKDRRMAQGLTAALKAQRLIRVPANTKMPAAEQIGMGSLILRPVSRKQDGSTEFIDIDFAPTDTGYKVFKASRYVGNPICYYTRKWIATKPTINKSLVCFCAQDIPDDWIAFEVVGFSKKKRSCFVKPVKGTMKDLLQHFTFEEGPITDSEPVIVEAVNKAEEA